MGATVDDLFQDGIVELRRKGRSPNTINGYEKIYGHNIRPTLGDAGGHVNRKTLTDLYAAHQARGLAPRTVYQINACLSSMFTQACPRGWRDSNPAECAEPLGPQGRHRGERLLAARQQVEPPGPRVELMASPWYAGPPLGPLLQFAVGTKVVAIRLPVRRRAIRSVGSRSSGVATRRQSRLRHPTPVGVRPGWRCATGERRPGTPRLRCPTPRDVRLQLVGIHQRPHTLLVREANDSVSVAFLLAGLGCRVDGEFVRHRGRVPTAESA